MTTYPTGTRLAHTILPGSTAIQIQHPIPPGTRITLTPPTSTWYAPHSETRTIAYCTGLTTPWCAVIDPNEPPWTHTYPRGTYVSYTADWTP